VRVTTLAHVTRFGKARWLGAAALVAAVVIVVIAVAGKGGGGGLKPQTTAPRTKQQPHAKPAPHGHREGVRRGRNGKADEPVAGSGPLVGIADQKPQTFSDPLFRRLGVGRSRLNTPWNSIFTEPGRLAGWLQAARSAGVEPLVAFEHARGDACPAQPCTLPPVAQYSKAIAAFHRTYPWVHLQIGRAHV